MLLPRLALDMDDCQAGTDDAEAKRTLDPCEVLCNVGVEWKTKVLGICGRLGYCSICCPSWLLGVGISGGGSMSTKVDGDVAICMYVC